MAIEPVLLFESERERKREKDGERGGSSVLPAGIMDDGERS